MPASSIGSSTTEKLTQIHMIDPIRYLSLAYTPCRPTSWGIDIHARLEIHHRTKFLPRLSPPRWRWKTCFTICNTASERWEQTRSWLFFVFPFYFWSCDVWRKTGLFFADWWLLSRHDGPVQDPVHFSTYILCIVHRFTVKWPHPTSTLYIISIGTNASGVLCILVDQMIPVTVYKVKKKKE